MDVAAAAEAVVADSSYSHVRSWAQDHLSAAASDVDALTNFAPRRPR